MVDYNQSWSGESIVEVRGSADLIKKICEDLLSTAFYNLDWKVAQDRCLVYLNHECSDVRGVAATCLGHVARIHKRIDREKVLEALTLCLKDDTIAGQVLSAIEDIEMFGGKV